MSEETSSTDEQRAQFTVADGDESISVSRFRTKRGERAEIATRTETTKLDALILESVSWQRSRDGLATVLDDGESVRDDETPLSGGDPVIDSPTIRISNEYTQVELEHVRTDAGEALRVRTPMRGSEIALGPSSLRALAAHDDTFAFAEFFETPVGPEDTRLEGPH